MRCAIQPGHDRGQQRARCGAALLIALTLLMLGSALRAGSAASSPSAARAARAHEAITVADAEARATVARYVMAWGAAENALVTGGELLTTAGARTSGIGALPVRATLRLLRLSSSRYVVAVECWIGSAAEALAVRRLSLVLDRPVPTDSTLAPAAPVPAPQWAMSDLY